MTRIESLVEAGLAKNKKLGAFGFIDLVRSEITWPPELEVSSRKQKVLRVVSQDLTLNLNSKSIQSLSTVARQRK